MRVEDEEEIWLWIEIEIKNNNSHVYEIPPVIYIFQQHNKIHYYFQENPVIGFWAWMSANGCELENSTCIWVVKNTCGVMFNGYVDTCVHNQHICAYHIAYEVLYKVAPFFLVDIVSGWRMNQKVVSCNEYKLFAKFKILVATYMVCRSKVYWG